MFIPTLSIFMATAISGMLEGVGFWNDVRQLLERAKTRSDVFAANVGLALLTGAVGCSQAIAVVMTPVSYTHLDVYKRQSQYS